MNAPKEIGAGSIIPSDEEVLLRTAKDAAEYWMYWTKFNRDAWEAINTEKTRLGWKAIFWRPILPPPLPAPLPTKLKIIAERMGWLSPNTVNGTSPVD